MPAVGDRELVGIGSPKHYLQKKEERPRKNVTRVLSEMGLADGTCNNRIATPRSYHGMAEPHRSATGPRYDDMTSDEDIYYFDERLPVYELVPCYAAQENQTIPPPPTNAPLGSCQHHPLAASPPTLKYHPQFKHARRVMFEGSCTTSGSTTTTPSSGLGAQGLAGLIAFFGLPTDDSAN